MKHLFVLTPESGCRPRFTTPVRVAAVNDHEFLIRVRAHLVATRVLAAGPVMVRHAPPTDETPGRVVVQQYTPDGRTHTAAITYRKEQP